MQLRMNACLLPTQGRQDLAPSQRGLSAIADWGSVPTIRTTPPPTRLRRATSPYGGGKWECYFGIVMVSTISASVSLRSDTAPMPAAWIRERDWVRLLRNPPRLTREGGFFS